VSRSTPFAALVAVALTVGTACGIPSDAEPTVLPGGIVMPAVAPTEPAGPPSAQVDVPVFLVQAEQLVKAVRPARSSDLRNTLDLLLAGPREAELAAGLRTAISPQTTVRSARLEGDTAVVDLNAALVEVGGQEQILAVAQIVLTATAVPGVRQVRVLLEGQAVEVPRADGTLSSEALRPEDYQTLVKGDQ
jgi:hypothetical protein